LNRFTANDPDGLVDIAVPLTPAPSPTVTIHLLRHEFHEFARMEKPANAFSAMRKPKPKSDGRLHGLALDIAACNRLSQLAVPEPGTLRLNVPAKERDGI